VNTEEKWQEEVGRVRSRDAALRRRDTRLKPYLRHRFCSIVVRTAAIIVITPVAVTIRCRH